jgi:hypothetical protein
MPLFSIPFWHSFLLHIEIMDILHNDESSCFLKWGVQFNIKLETSPNISNLTLKLLKLNPYAVHRFKLWKKPARQGILWVFQNTCLPM